MTREARYLGKHVLPDLAEPRLTRQYAAVRAGMRGGAPRAWRAPLFAAAGALALVIVVATVTFALARRHDPRLALSTVLDSDEAGATRVRLPEGSSFTLERGGRATMVAPRADLLEVRLERGSVSVDVAHPDLRGITVHAGGHVVGARGRGPRLCFVVSLAPDGGDAAITVSHGAIDVVLPDGGVRAIGEGETWSSPRPAVSATATAAAQASPGDTAFELDDEPSPAPRAPLTGAARKASGASGARELLDEAQQALADGRTKEAARLFDTIRRRFRADPRAGLAAFELGRLRLDHFGDAPGAEEAFRDAMTLSPLPSAREDAEARRVQTLDRMGAHDRCVSARDAYLARFPSGVHKGAVGASCGER